MANRELPAEDPVIAAKLHELLIGSLEQQFLQPLPEQLAYDGLLWRVRAGVVKEPSNTALEGVQLTLRQGVYVPELYRADVHHPDIHPQYFEYSGIGGFTVHEYQPRDRVYMGQFLSMRDMVDSVVLMPGLTELRAGIITDAYYAASPDEPRHEMLLAQDSVNEAFRSPIDPAP